MNHYEFGGPIGAFGIVIGLPIVIYFLYFICNKDICYLSASSPSDGSSSNINLNELNNAVEFNLITFYNYLLQHVSLQKLFSIEATFIYLGMTFYDHNDDKDNNNC